MIGGSVELSSKHWKIFILLSSVSLTEIFMIVYHVDPATSEQAKEIYSGKLKKSSQIEFHFSSKKSI